MPYVYEPEGNKTPVHHPVIGHLVYGDVYDHPDCASHPDFKEVIEKPEPSADETVADTTETSEPEAEETSHKRTSAAKSGKGVTHANTES